MRILSLAASLLVLCTVTTLAQTKTTETKTVETEVDSTQDGKVRKTETVTSIASSEDITVRENMVYVDPIKFFGLFNVGYQRAIAPGFSVGGTIQSPTQLTDASGIGFSVEGRYYPMNRMFRGFHLGANVAYNNLTYERYSYETQQIEKIEFAPFSTGVLIGWHWYPWSDFATEIALGADYNFTGEERGDYFSEQVPFLSNRKGLIPSLRFNIGYAW